MRSTRPKPLHRLCGRPMVLHVLDALAEICRCTRVVVVVGHRAEWVTKTLVEHAPPGLSIEFVEQGEPRGTGDAMAVALTGLPDDEGGEDGDVVVLPGDTPLLRPVTLASLLEAHRISGAAATLLTAVVEEPAGYGRVVRGRDDAVARVVEHDDATDEEQEVRRGQHLDLLLQAGRARARAAPAEPGQRAGRVLPHRPVTVLYEAGHNVGSVVVEDPMEVGRRQRPCPARRRRGRAARPDQRAVDAPRA